MSLKACLSAARMCFFVLFFAFMALNAFLFSPLLQDLMLRRKVFLLELLVWICMLAAALSFLSLWQKAYFEFITTLYMAGVNNLLS